MPWMSNSNSRLESLPLDVRDRLLMSLPSFATLRTAVLSCKALHEAYAMRKRSIFCTVVENEVGPALAEALVVTRLTRDFDDLDSDNLGDIKDEVVDREGKYWKDEISVEDAYALEDVGRVASGLEDEFSSLFKNRNKRTSALTYAESLTFRRALYHNWILALLCRSPYDGPDEEDLEDMDDEFFVDPNTSENLVRIISDLDDKSLCATHQVLLFLDELFGHTHPRQMYFPHNQSVRFGAIRPVHLTPQQIFDDYAMRNSTNHYCSSLATRYMVKTGLDDLLRKRDVLKVLQEKFKGQALLSGVSEGHPIECHKCHKVTPWLYNDSCWSKFSECLPEQTLWRCLPVRLSTNVSARDSMLHYTDPPPPNFYHHFMEDVFASQNDPTAIWPKNEWVCADCVVGLVIPELLGWLLRRLGEDGHVFKPNCWYGYKCRTQTHNQEHAKKLNHICEPDPDKLDGH